MKSIANQIRLQYGEDDKPQIVLSLQMPRREAQEAVSKLKEILSKGKYLQVEIKQYRARRSLDANAYLWVLLQKMAEILDTSKDELYLEELSRYGVFTHIIVKPNMVEKVKQEWRTVRELGEVTVNGQTGVQLQCFFGSSSYDSKEFSVLLDGVVSDAKELEIETMTPAEIESMKQAWGR
jgi:hypothetical protein